MMPVLSVELYQGRKRQSADSVLPVTSAMDVGGVEVTSLAVMSMSRSCSSSSAESTPNLILVSGTKSATAVSAFPGVVLLTYWDSGRIFLKPPFPIF
jgi:hypothetical protein